MCELNKKPAKSGKTQTKFLTATKSMELNFHKEEGGMKDVWDALWSIEGSKAALCKHAHTNSQRAQENWIKRD